MNKKTICHMTHIDNLDRIIHEGGLLAKNFLKEQYFKSIANQDVQDKRSRTIVPIHPGGNLHDYVPFYFWGQTPMLLVNRNQQENIIFLVSYIETITNASIPYIFTDRHAIVKSATFYNDPVDLDKLDWITIKTNPWHSTNEKPDRQEKKQAEFLIYSKIKWELIDGIGVINDNTNLKVQTILGTCTHKPSVKNIPQWYYL